MQDSTSSLPELKSNKTTKSPDASLFGFEEFNEPSPQVQDNLHQNLAAHQRQPLAPLMHQSWTPVHQTEESGAPVNQPMVRQPLAPLVHQSDAPLNQITGAPTVPSTLDVPAHQPMVRQPLVPLAYQATPSGTSTVPGIPGPSVPVVHQPAVPTRQPLAPLTIPGSSGAEALQGLRQPLTPLATPGFNGAGKFPNTSPRFGTGYDVASTSLGFGAGTGTSKMFGAGSDITGTIPGFGTGSGVAGTSPMFGAATISAPGTTPVFGAASGVTGTFSSRQPLAPLVAPGLVQSSPSGLTQSGTPIIAPGIFKSETTASSTSPATPGEEQTTCIAPSSNANVQTPAPSDGVQANTSAPPGETNQPAPAPSDELTPGETSSVAHVGPSTPAPSSGGYHPTPRSSDPAEKRRQMKRSRTNQGNHGNKVFNIVCRTKMTNLRLRFHATFLNVYSLFFNFEIQF